MAPLAVVDGKAVDTNPGKDNGAVGEAEGGKAMTIWGPEEGKIWVSRRLWECGAALL